MLKRYDKALLTEDYLIRMINMMVAALLQVVGLRQAGSYAEAQIAIDQVIEQVFGLRADLVRRLDDGYLLARLTHQGVLNTDQLLLLADLLREEAGLFGEGNRQADSYWSYLRALNFYLEVVMRGGPFDYPEPHDKIEAVLSQLDRFSLPSDTLASLSTYYEGRGAYARAEAVYLKLLETADYRERVFSELAEFYQRLLAVPAVELASGGLDQAYVVRRLSEMRDRGET
jgi:hypothetical protein